ncbi:hypothetical protein ECC02_000899 [Trypanosoma cruzi]|uniref:Uncharacterized protein n=1 Tax=Trypanosoma cruzi TaxID=5693 RepID=A0A7J6YI27_TRYCR|nr:hypothetical protein ECC02_000899 [Trypanosoma cruzi]
MPRQMNAVGPLNIHKELEELTNCEPLRKLSASQKDWLLDSTSHYRNNSNTGAAPNVNTQLTSSFRNGEEEAISEGLSRVESASTARGTQRPVNTGNCSNSNAEKAVARYDIAAKADTATAHASPLRDESIGGTLITLEVSSSSATPEGLLSSPSPMLLSGCAMSSPVTSRGIPGKNHTRTAAKRGVRQFKTSSTKTCSNKGGRPCSKGAIISLVGTPNSRRSSLAHVSPSGLKKVSEKSSVKIHDAGIRSMSVNFPVVSANPYLEKGNQGVTTNLPSPAIQSRDFSVATVAAAQKTLEQRNGSSQPWLCADERTSSFEVFVSSESDTEAAQISFPLAQQRQNPPLINQGQSRVPAENTVSASVSASTSVVAVIDVYEVTEKRAAQPLKEEKKNTGQSTLSHRFKGNMSPSSENKIGNPKEREKTRIGSKNRERSVPLEELKRVAMEEEEKKIQQERNQNEANKVNHKEREEANKGSEVPEVKREVSKVNVRQKSVTGSQERETITQRNESEARQSQVALISPPESRRALSERPMVSKPEGDNKSGGMDEVRADHDDEGKRVYREDALYYTHATYMKQKSKAKCCSVM